MGNDITLSPSCSSYLLPSSCLDNRPNDTGCCGAASSSAIQSEFNQTDQQAMLPMLQDYTESAEKCLQTASEFLRQASLMREALEAYEKLIKTRAEIRRVLD